MKNKKGQLGVDTAKAFIIGLLGLLLIGIVIAIVMASLSSVDLATTALSATNESGAYINATGYTLSAASSAYEFSSPAITAIYNASNGVLISSGNYTLSAAGVLTNASATNWGAVNVSYTYKAGNYIGQISGNGTSAVATLFTNTSTWLSLLGVVLIISIIAVVIVIVNRFGSRSF